MSCLVPKSKGASDSDSVNCPQTLQPIQLKRCEPSALQIGPKLTIAQGKLIMPSTASSSGNFKKLT